MTERADLLEAVAATVADYRDGEIDRLTPTHVDRWVYQFASDVQVPLLRELDHVLKRTYITRVAMASFFRGTLTDRGLAGTNPCEFWKSASLLCIQQNGQSQEEMLDLLAEGLEAEWGIGLEDCASVGGTYVYLDDVLFTGSRIGNDLSAWIEDEAPATADVYVVVHTLHAFGLYKCRQRLAKAAADAGKRIQFYFWATASLENRYTHRHSSVVLWPSELPADPDLNAYLAIPSKFPVALRKPGGPLGAFSSEEGRQLLERELLLAGVGIRASHTSPKDSLRPLGFSALGLGFGSMIVTYRNCPNTTPLALWWGIGSSRRNSWYPLFPCKRYTETVDVDVLPF